MQIFIPEADAYSHRELSLLLSTLFALGILALRRPPGYTGPHADIVLHTAAAAAIN